MWFITWLGAGGLNGCHERAKAERSGGSWVNDYSFFSDSPFCQFGDDGSDDKGLRSQEWTSATMTEGFANFVAFDSWNVHGDSDANPVAYMWDSTPDPAVLVNLEFGHVGYETAYCDLYCDRTQPYHPYCVTGTGTMLDWQRHLWDYHTNNYAGMTGVRQTHSEMLDMAIIGWAKGDAFWTIYGGLSGTDDDRWFANGDVNGLFP